MKRAAFGYAILAAFFLSNCSTERSSSNDANDGGDRCVRTASGYCASGGCPQTWSEAQNRAVWCGSSEAGVDPSGPSTTFVTVSTSCMGFDVAHAVRGKDTGRDYYYDHGTGELVAVYRFVSGAISCEAGPDGFSPPQCGASTPLFSCGRSGPPSGCDLCCVPGDVSSFMPTWKPPTGFNQGKCTDLQVNALVDCLNNVPDVATCKTFGADLANKACLDCAITRSTASAYGPLVEDSVTAQVNVAGCIALATGDLSATGCGAKRLALSQCELAACEINCPVFAGDTGSELAALLACLPESDTSSCKTFAADAACGSALEGDGGIAAACAQTRATFAENAKAMVQLFCGGIAADGGVTDVGDGG
jgi:hypothetical protein